MLFETGLSFIGSALITLQTEPSSSSTVTLSTTSSTLPSHGPYTT
ncbi:unnamed protein product [Spirodela intermedia]|uniref:Uncharacterized protein n=2 Tax=Spirodela intermedia TaxID=51605 RepID=A0A7I8K319_SPIIN|nr:unnamed protein product [Spirodela intermedia]CAA6656008.1 unnamed protein product [Spirodela intermedia]CAA7391440.1 unnamed protein product [Spirodela intermedia]